MAKDQMNVRVPAELRAKVIALAQVRGERDPVGGGASVIVRRAFEAYLAEHADELPDWWQRHLDTKGDVA